MNGAINIYPSFHDQLNVVILFACAFHWFSSSHLMSSLHSDCEQMKGVSHSENEPMLLGRDNDILLARYQNPRSGWFEQSCVKLHFRGQQIIVSQSFLFFHEFSPWPCKKIDEISPKKVIYHARLHNTNQGIATSSQSQSESLLQPC